MKKKNWINETLSQSEFKALIAALGLTHHLLFYTQTKLLPNKPKDFPIVTMNYFKGTIKTILKKIIEEEVRLANNNGYNRAKTEVRNKISDLINI